MVQSVMCNITAAFEHITKAPEVGESGSNGAREGLEGRAEVVPEKATEEDDEHK